MKPAKRGKPSRAEERGLSRDAILREALTLIGDVGLERFSVRLLAQRLKVFPAAIYWWIPTRNELLASLVNLVFADVMPQADPNDWRAWLRELFHRSRKEIHKHPKIAPLIASQLLSNVGANFQMIERILAVLYGAGFRDERLLSAYDIVITAQIGFVSMELAATPEERSAGFAAVMQDTIEKLRPEEFPMINRFKPRLVNRHFVLRWENGVTVPLDDSFEAYTYTIIEGLRQLLTR